MHEITTNPHMHTRYSDGQATHEQIARAAMQVGLDAVIITDHNVWVSGPEGYYTEGDRHVLLLVGEEIHDQARDPQKNHLLVFGAAREMAPLAYNPQRLLDTVRQVGGLAFLAHPVDPASPRIGEKDISWVDWNVMGYTGIELWNGLSEFRSRSKSKLHAIYYACNFPRIARCPFPEAIHKWDELLAQGRKIVAIGGADAHAYPASLGPFRRILFPYQLHFRAINTHLLLPQPMSGDLLEDRYMVLDALRQGHAFIGYDLPASTRGFRFIAQGQEGVAQMGDEISCRQGVTLQIHLPQITECRLMKDGKILKEWWKRDNMTHITSEPGVYRVEAYIRFLGSRRGWIFSNPIYVR